MHFPHCLQKHFSSGLQGKAIFLSWKKSGDVSISASSSIITATQSLGITEYACLWNTWHHTMNLKLSWWRYSIWARNSLAFGSEFRWNVYVMFIIEINLFLPITLDEVKKQNCIWVMLIYCYCCYHMRSKILIFPLKQCSLIR